MEARKTYQDRLKIIKVEKIKDILPNKLGSIKKYNSKIILYVMTWDKVFKNMRKNTPPILKSLQTFRVSRSRGYSKAIGDSEQLSFGQALLCIVGV